MWSGFRKVWPFNAIIFALFHLLCALIDPYEVMANESKTLVFVSARPEGDPKVQQLSEVYSRILKKMGIVFEYRDLPARRAGMASNTGEVDGELTRVYSYNNKYTNLVRVEEMNHQSEFAAYAINTNISFHGWESLKGYNIDCRRGVKICVSNVSKVTNMHEINTVEQLVMRLINKYSDAFIQQSEHFDALMKSDWFTQIDKKKEVRKVGVMQIVTAHAFLHKKHQVLVPRISELLKEMKLTGEYQRIRGWPADRMK